MAKRLFSSESVTEGHPDKIADQISDSILDAMLADDPDSHVAVETLVTTGLVVVAGEVDTQTYVDIPRVVRNRILEIGYDSSEKGFDAATPAASPCRWVSSPRTSGKEWTTPGRSATSTAPTRSMPKGRATRG